MTEYVYRLSTFKQNGYQILSNGNWQNSQALETSFKLALSVSRGPPPFAQVPLCFYFLAQNVSESLPLLGFVVSLSLKTVLLSFQYQWQWILPDILHIVTGCVRLAKFSSLPALDFL